MSNIFMNKFIKNHYEVIGTVRNGSFLLPDSLIIFTVKGDGAALTEGAERCLIIQIVWPVLPIENTLD